MGTPGSNNVLLHFMCVEHQARTPGRRDNEISDWTMRNWCWHSLWSQMRPDCPLLPVRNTNIVTALPSEQTIIGKLQPLLLATREQCRDHVYIRRLTWEINETFEGLLRVVCDHSAVLSLLQIILPPCIIYIALWSFVSALRHLTRPGKPWDQTRQDLSRAEV